MKNLWVAYCAYAALSSEVVIAMLEKRSQLVSRYLHVKRVLILNYCDTSTSSAPLFPSYLLYTLFPPARTHYLWLVRFLRHFINIFQTCSPTSEKFSETTAAYEIKIKSRRLYVLFMRQAHTKSSHGTPQCVSPFNVTRSGEVAGASSSRSKYVTKWWDWYWFSNMQMPHYPSSACHMFAKGSRVKRWALTQVKFQVPRATLANRKPQIAV